MALRGRTMRVNDDLALIISLPQHCCLATSPVKLRRWRRFRKPFPINFLRKSFRDLLCDGFLQKFKICNRYDDRDVRAISLEDDDIALRGFRNDVCVVLNSARFNDSTSFLSYFRHGYILGCISINCNKDLNSRRLRHRFRFGILDPRVKQRDQRLRQRFLDDVQFRQRQTAFLELTVKQALHQ